MYIGPRLSSGGRIALPPQNIIQNHEVGQRLAERFQLKERSPVPTLAMEIQPVVLVDDLTSQDQRTGFREFAQGTSFVAVAGQGSCASIEMPVGAQGFAALQGVYITIDAGAVTEVIAGWVNGQSIGGGSATAQALSGFLFPPAASEAFLHGFTGAALPALTTSWLIAIGPNNPGPHYLDLRGVTVAPGQAFAIKCTTNNVHQTYSFRWREMPTAR